MERLMKTEVKVQAANQMINSKLARTDQQSKEEYVPKADSGKTDSGKTDNVEWSSQMKEEDWDRLVSQVLDKIKKQYPQIQITMTGQEEGKSRKELAVLLGKGNHIVISKEFIERMKSSREEFGKCCAALSGAAKQLAGQKNGKYSNGVFLDKDQAQFWSLTGHQKQEKKQESLLSVMMKKQDENNPLKKNFRMSVSASVSAAGNYSKVAGAKTKSQVREAMGDVQRDIGSLKMVSCFGDSEEQVKARRAIKSLQKLLSRGNRKIQRLNKEELRQYAQKRARKQQQRRREEQIKLELKKMQSARKSADHALIKEGEADDAYIRGYRQYKKASELYREEMGLDPMAGLSGELGLPAGGDPMAGGDMQSLDFAASDSFSF